MKTATIPPVRIDPAFRQDLERSLANGETLASLVETAVRYEVARRQAQSEFVRRGLESIHRTLAAGDGLPVEAVMVRLEAKLAATRNSQQA